MAMRQQVRVAVIGFGGIGSAHVRCIARGGVDGMQLAAVCDIDPAKRDAVSQQYPGIRVEADFHALLDGTVDAVVDLEKKQVTVSGDADLTALKQAIIDAGYEIIE